jgi:hypothetical protein
MDQTSSNDNHQEKQQNHQHGQGERTTQEVIGTTTKFLFLLYLVIKCAGKRNLTKRERERKACKE